MNEFVFKLPDLAEGTIEAEIGEWFVQVGDSIAEDDVICTMMTDKAAVEITSPVSGRITSVGGETGDLVAVGATLVVIDIGLEVKDANSLPVESSRSEPPKPAPESAAGGAPPRRSGRIITSPAIRRRAREAGVELSTIEGSGPSGRILRSDFEEALRRSTAVLPASPNSDAASHAVTEIKIRGLRRAIARRMTETNLEVPAFTYVEEIDVTELDKLRHHFNSESESRLTVLPFIGLALVRTLRDHPRCNSTYEKARNVLLQHQCVHLGIATHTENGLKVPVVRHCERRSLFDLAEEISRISASARNDDISSRDLSGSTITITSLGKLGGIMTSPIINSPEVAIVGVNRICERPIVADGNIVTRRMMNVSASFDHRFIDGHDAASMIQSLKGFLEYPATLFVDRSGSAG